jgi:hypothetical protein
MNMLSSLGDIARSPGDPTVVRTGPSSMYVTDHLARGLGWFSMGLGAAELLAAGPMARWLGLDGREWLIRAYGVREIAAGVPTLSFDKGFGLASRIAGDALDMATLFAFVGKQNRKRGNAAIALALVAGVTLLDIAAARGVARERRNPDAGHRDYSDRSGLPHGTQASRGLARQSFRTPSDMQADLGGPSPSPGSIGPAGQRD